MMETTAKTIPMPPLTVIRGGANSGASAENASLELTEAPPGGDGTGPQRMGAREREARLRMMVNQNIDFVARTLRNAGTPPAEVDDEVQRTFMVAARRLDDVRPGAERRFLLQIALHQAAHARRSLARRRETLADETLDAMETLATPEQLTDQKRVRQLLDRVLDEMPSDLRTVFVLYEFEEMNMGEIAQVLGIPPGTVASRLRRARAEFRRRVTTIDGLSTRGREP
jgi:RNA polymerase sigma-70 factor, ECF subfamily